MDCAAPASFAHTRFTLHKHPLPPREAIGGVPEKARQSSIFPRASPPPPANCNWRGGAIFREIFTFWRWGSAIWRGGGLKASRGWVALRLPVGQRLPARKRLTITI